MANTIVVADMLQKNTIKVTDKLLVAKPYCNTEFEWELRQAGTTVRVPIFPNVTWTTWGTAGDTISNSTFTITSDTLTVAQVAQVRVGIADIEEVKSNISLVDNLAERLAYDLAKKYDAHILSVAQAGATTALDDGDFGGTPTNAYTLTKSNIFNAISEMWVALDDLDVEDGNRVLFVTPWVASLIRESGIYDSTESGLAVRTRGYVWEAGGFSIVKTTNLPSGYIVAMTKGAVHFVEQLWKMKIVDQVDAMWSNTIGEAVYQAKVFSPNADRVASLKFAI